jgi:hypothetical protein
MTIHSKMSLHAFGSGSTGYSRIWRNNIKKNRLRKNSNILAITLDASLINDTDFIGTSQAVICIGRSMCFYSFQTNNALFAYHAN